MIIMNENQIGKIVVDCALNLHKELGPGLLETVYEVLLSHELELQARISVEFRRKPDERRDNKTYQWSDSINISVTLCLCARY